MFFSKYKCGILYFTKSGTNRPQNSWIHTLGLPEGKFKNIFLKINFEIFFETFSIFDLCFARHNNLLCFDFGPPDHHIVPEKYSAIFIILSIIPSNGPEWLPHFKL